MDKVLVTGGTGFLGRHLVNNLVNEGYDVTLLARRSSNVSWLEGKEITVAYGDVTNADSIHKAIKGCKFIIHAAGFFRFWGLKNLFYEVNLEGTKNVVKAVLNSDIQRMVFVSTIAVVGDPPPNALIDEEIECNPQDDYQKSKLSAERHILQNFRENNLPAIVVRPGAFYGPGSSYGFNRLFIEEPMRGWRVKVEGGERLTFPVYVPDVAKIVVNALKLGKPGKIYNISDKSVTHNHVNLIVSKILGISSWRIKVSSPMMIGLAGIMELAAKMTTREPFYPLNLRHYVFNDWNVVSDLAKVELGFSTTPLEDGLRSTVDWFLNRSR